MVCVMFCNLIHGRFLAKKGRKDQSQSFYRVQLTEYREQLPSGRIARDVGAVRMATPNFSLLTYKNRPRMTRINTNKSVKICAICGEKTLRIFAPLREYKTSCGRNDCVSTLNGNTGNDDEYVR